jgi:VanZ family protein
VRQGQQGTALRTLLSWLPVVAYTVLIWVLSSRTLDIRLEAFPFRDKGVHFCEYGVLGFLMTHAVHVTWPRARRGLLAAFWLTVSLGLTDELHQAYVPGRSADGLDLVADALGALSAIVLYAFLRRLLSRRAAVSAKSEAREPSAAIPRERTSEESL